MSLGEVPIEIWRAAACSDLREFTVDGTRVAAAAANAHLISNAICPSSRSVAKYWWTLLGKLDFAVPEHRHHLPRVLNLDAALVDYETPNQESLRAVISGSGRRRCESWKKNIVCRLVHTRTAGREDRENYE